MKKSLISALTLTAALSVAACKDEEARKPLSEEELQQIELAQHKANQDFLSEFRIAVQALVTRNGQDFTVNLQALCYDRYKDEDYKQSCSGAAVEAMREKFACSSYPLASGSTLSGNPAVLLPGWVGIKRDIPQEYLFTEERWTASIAPNKKRFNPDNYYVIESIDNLDAVTAPVTDENRPDFCPDNY